MNSDFCKLQPCKCMHNCVDHHIFQSNIDESMTDNIPKFSKTHAIEEIKQLKMPPTKIEQIQIRKAQNDIGANASVTNIKESILLYRDISPFAVGGVQKDDPAITCTGKGYILWQSTSGESLLIPTYYCSEADGTI